MELQCVRDAHVTGRKRKAGYLYMRSRQERAEVQLQEQNVENDALRELVEQHKLTLEKKMQNVDELTGLLRENVCMQERAALELEEQKVENAALRVVVEQHKRCEEAVTEELKLIKVMLQKKMENVDALTSLLKAKTVELENQKMKGDELREELNNRNSRVMELEADKFFLNGDFHEKCIVEEQLMQTITQLRQSCLDEKKRQDREGPRKTRIMVKVLRAFQWDESTADPVLLRAVCDFWYGLSECNRATEGDERDTRKRISQREVMNMWKEVTLNGWGGQMRKLIQKEFIRRKRYCPIQMALASDVNSTFNVRAASEIGKCDLSREKYERGLLPSDQTCRRVMQCVYNAAVHNGFSSFPALENGNIWCWGDGDIRFTKGVNRYVFEVYRKIDPDCVMAPEHDPWLVPLTGDGTRVSYRGKSITMCGVKQADVRLPSQHETGKSMNQSRHMYIPALAGYTDESSIMPYFEDFVGAFREIEKRGYCVVDGEQHKVHIRPFVVGDLAFEQKYLQRGGGSGKTTRFCFMCSNTCHYRHKGYPGGCWKCRELGTVYDEETGVQQCLCHDVCTPEFLQWEKERFEALTVRVGTNIPMSKLPPWESVGALRHECCKRCYTAQDRTRLNKMTTESQMQHWLLKRCRQGCTLTANEAHGIRFCPIAIVELDLTERNIPFGGLSEMDKRRRLELVLREEEEWQGMVMYRRDTRFSSAASTDDMKLLLDRTVIDMLHLPMRTNEKVLNLLYEEILNGKTKNDVNGKRRVSTKKKHLVGDAAVGQQVAKMLVNDQGLPELLRGVVTLYTEEGNGEFYTVSYDEQHTEELCASEYREANKFAQLLQKDNINEEGRQHNVEKTIVAPRLEQLTDVIRELGSLGSSWSHHWEEGKTKCLKKIKLPFDQSKKIFKEHHLPRLQAAVDVAVSDARPEHRCNWHEFVEHYVEMMASLTKSDNFEALQIEALDATIKKCYAVLIKIAGIKACTNYFHLLGSGHVIWLTRKYGNLWRWRNEGAESQNGVLSLRYNKFNNRGGNKGNSANKDMKQKCFPFQVLGAWMARLTMWQLGLGEALFEADMGCEGD